MTNRLFKLLSVAMGILMIPIAAQAALFAQINIDTGDVHIVNDDLSNTAYLGQYILTSDTANTWSPAPERWSQIGMDISSSSDQTLQEGQIISDAVAIGAGGILNIGNPYQWTNFANPPTITFTYSASDTPAGSLTIFENARVVFVPEPASLALLGLLGICLVKARPGRAV